VLPVPNRLQAALSDRYLQQELGRGGMATVYLARDLKHRRAVPWVEKDPDLNPLRKHPRFAAILTRI